MRTYVVLEDTPGIAGTTIADTAQTLTDAEARAVELARESLPSLRTVFSVDLIDVCGFCFREPTQDDTDFCSESCYTGWWIRQRDLEAHERAQQWPWAV